MTRVALALALPALAVGAAAVIVDRIDRPPARPSASTERHALAGSTWASTAAPGVARKLPRDLADLLRKLPTAPAPAPAPTRPSAPLPGRPGRRIDPCFREGAGPCLPVCRYRTRGAQPSLSCPAMAPEGCLHLAVRPRRPAAPGSAPQPTPRGACAPRATAPSPQRGIAPIPQP